MFLRSADHGKHRIARKINESPWLTHRRQKTRKQKSNQINSGKKNKHQPWFWVRKQVHRRRKFSGFANSVFFGDWVLTIIRFSFVGENK